MKSAKDLNSTRANPKALPRAIADKAITRVEEDNAYVDIVLSHYLDSEHVDERDRAFISELVRGVIRWKKRLDWIVDQLFTGKKQDMPAPVRRLLWQALYQIEFMTVPAFAAVNESIRLARAQKLHRWTGVMNGILRNYDRRPESIVFPDKTKDPVAYIAVTESFPEWLVERWLHQFGFEKTRAFCRANNAIPNLSVRVNQLKISVTDFEQLLTRHHTRFRRSVVPGFYRIDKIEYKKRLQFIDDGLMTVQDESAGLVGLLAAPKSGQVVADLCAAPGGKSTHLAELMHNQGIVLSGDVNKRRINLVRHAAQRLDLTSVFPVLADAQHFPAQTCDLVLLDAPCSGFGVMRKKPDLRWKKTPDDLTTLHDLQKMLIRCAAELVASHGVLVYSTCTIDPQENEDIVSDFCKHSDFIVSREEHKFLSNFITENGYIRTWPHVHHMDGSFAVKMIKRNRT